MKTQPQSPGRDFGAVFSPGGLAPGKMATQMPRFVHKILKEFFSTHTLTVLKIVVYLRQNERRAPNEVAGGPPGPAPFRSSQ